MQEDQIWDALPDKTIADALLALGRRDLSQVIQIITGHSFTRYHLFKMGQVESSFCRFCGDDREETWHIIANCQGLDQCRRVVFSHEVLDSAYFNSPQDFLRLPGFVTKANIGFLFNPIREQQN